MFEKRFKNSTSYLSETGSISRVHSGLGGFITFFLCFAGLQSSCVHHVRIFLVSCLLPSATFIGINQHYIFS